MSTIDHPPTATPVQPPPPAEPGRADGGRGRQRLSPGRQLTLILMLFSLGWFVVLALLSWRLLPPGTVQTPVWFSALLITCLVGGVASSWLLKHFWLGRLETERQAQARQLENLIAVARAAVERPTLDETLQNILDATCTITRAERGDLLLLEESGALARFIVSPPDLSPTQRREWATAIMNQGLAGWTARQRQAVLIPDTALDERWLPPPNFPLTRSALSVPICRGEHLVGVLTLFHSQVAHFTHADLELIQAATDQIALAIYNARIYDEQRRLANLQATLYETLHAISGRLEIGSVINQAVETISRLTGWPSVTLLLPNEYPYYLTVRAAAGAYSPPIGWRIPMAQGITGRAFRQGVTQHVPDVTTDPEYLLFHTATRSELAVPVRRGERLLGLLNIESDQFYAFSEDDLLLAESLADAISLVLENARALEELRQYAGKVNAMYALARMLSQSLVLQEMLFRALGVAVNSLGFEGGLISLVNPTTGRLELSAEWALPPQLSEWLRRVGMEKTLCAYVWNRRTPLLIGDIESETPLAQQMHAELHDFFSHMQAWGIRSYVGTPLLHQEQSLGALCLFARQPHIFSGEDSALQLTIGQQIATTVTNATLFQAVTDERGRLQALIESSRDGIIFIGLDQKILVVNAAALTLLGVADPPETWTGCSLAEALLRMRHSTPEGARAALYILRRPHTDRESSREGELGVHPHIMHWINLPVLSGGTPLGHLIVLRDVTEERLLERMRDDLTNTMVHDLRNPLTAIYGALKLLEKSTAGMFSPAQLQMVGIINSGVQRMLRLVNAIMDISRLESGRMPIELAPIILPDFIAEILQSQAPIAAEKNIRLESAVPSGLPPAWADAGLIRRVLENIIGNAIKFTPAGGLIRLRVRESEEAERRRFLISVSDTGPGIPPDIRERLFQKFATGPQPERGSGLGLAFCKMAIAAHKERIWVESTSSSGTTITFTLAPAPTE